MIKTAVGYLTHSAPLLLVFSTMIWGGNAVAGKLAVGEISPMLLTLARWGVGLCIIAFVARPHLRRDWPVIRCHLPYLFFVGATGFSIFNGFLYSAVQYTSAINVAILQAGMPMVIFVLSYAAFRIAATWAQIIGYTLTLAGVAWLAGQGDLNRLLALEFNYGDLIMLGGVLTYSIFSVALKSKPEMHWLSFLAMLMLASTIVAFGLVGWEWSQNALHWSGSIKAWLLVGFTAIFPSILSQASFIRSVELIGGNRAAIFLNLVPIWGALFAVILVGEIFSLYHAIALTLVIGGILLAQLLSQQK